MGPVKYSSRYIHKISPRTTDIGPDVELSPGETGDRKALAAKLRGVAILCMGQRIQHHRVELDGKVICFPQASIWHSIILTPAPLAAQQEAE